MQKAIRLHQESGAIPELARSYVSYARLLQQWGANSQAQEYLGQATELFERMGMTGDLTEAKRILQQVRP